MKLSKGVKIAIGVMTAWVCLYPFLFFIVWLASFGMIFMADSAGGEPSPAIMLPFMAIFPLHFITIGLIFILVAFYITHIVKNREGNEVIRIIVALGLYMMPYIAMPLYFFAYIWPETPPAWAMQSAAKPAIQSDTPSV